MPVDTRIVRTLDAFNSQRQSVVDRITGLVTALFADFDQWTNPGPITQVTTLAGRYVSVGQRQIAGLTDAYLARTTSLLRGEVVSPAGVGPEMSNVLRRGQDSFVKVYSRLPAEYRYQLSLGRSKDEALKLTLQRAREMSATDLDLAHRDQAAKFTTVRHVGRYRRVIRGEGTCGLCIAAADRIYSRGDLLPIHNNCRCAVMDVSELDPARELNDQDITNLYGEAVQAAGSTSAKKLLQVKVSVVEHGELGPQLHVVGQHFRGPAQVGAAA